MACRWPTDKLGRSVEAEVPAAQQDGVKALIIAELRLRTLPG